MGSFKRKKKVRQFRNSPFFAGVYVWAFFNDGENNFPGNIPNTARHFELHHQPPPRKNTYLLIDISMYFPLLNLKQKKYWSIH